MSVETDIQWKQSDMIEVLLSEPDDFLINSVKPRKRFSPWARKDSIDYLDVVKEYYGYNDDKALQALRILTKDQLDKISYLLRKGGNNGKRD